MVWFCIYKSINEGFVSTKSQDDVLSYSLKNMIFCLKLILNTNQSSVVEVGLKLDREKKKK
jgi:hypothetical protein